MTDGSYSCDLCHDKGWIPWWAGARRGWTMADFETEIPKSIPCTCHCGSYKWSECEPYKSMGPVDIEAMKEASRQAARQNVAFNAMLESWYAAMPESQRRAILKIPQAKQPPARWKESEI